MAAARRRHRRRPGDDLLKRIAVVWLVGAALIAAVAGCGGGKNNAAPATTTPTARTVRVYFLRDGKVQPVWRTVSSPRPAPISAWTAIGTPNAAESKLGLVSELTTTGAWTGGVGRDNVPFLKTGPLSRAALAQTVYTMTQFPASHTVVVNDKTYTRKDFEDQTPIILVESPLPFQTVTSPLHATGTANTFEATFQYDLVGPDGKLIKTHFVTATSGSGTRGTFDFSVPFAVDRTGPGKLIVYERSAENGRRIHQVEIPIQLAK